jgi:hypothetical protein
VIRQLAAAAVRTPEFDPGGHVGKPDETHVVVNRSAVMGWRSMTEATFSQMNFE